MENVRVDRIVSIWAGTVLSVALALAPTPAVAADHGPEARQPMPMTQHLGEGIALPFELLFDTGTEHFDDGLEVAILNGPKIDPNG